MSLFTIVQKYVTNLVPSNYQYLLLFYFTWSVVHHMSPYLYIYFCTPNTLWGITASPFMVAAPHCTGLRWTIYESGNTINTMWISFAVYITTRIIFRKP